MGIGMLTDMIREDEKLIIDAAKRKGVRLEAIDTSEKSFNITDFRDNQFKDFDVFLQRCVSILRGLYITKILESYGYTVVNDFQSSYTCNDKVQCSIALAKNNVPTPETFVSFTEESGLHALKKLGYPAIIKPVSGSWARLVAKVNDEDAAKSIMEDRKMMGAAYGVFYLQRHVNKPNRDIRATIIGGKVVAAIYRNVDGDWRTNTARGAVATKCEITPEIEELSLNAAKAMGEGMFGVDIMEDGEGYVVQEVNHSFEFKNVQRVTGVDIAGEIIEYLKGVARK